MTEPILHHYPRSPFSEKVRLMLGYKGLPWRSVIIPSVSPKPDLVALTGGYRRTPVLQIGSDIYCDTALIADVLERLAPAPTLYPAPHKGLARTLAQWADSTLFWAAMPVNFQPIAAPSQLAGMPPEAARVFGDDRARMSVGMTRLRWPDASAAYKSYLRRLSDMLEAQPYLLGGAPCIADFSAYHPLWFTRRIEVLQPLLAATPDVLAWMDRMAAIGHGASTPMTAQEAIEVARSGAPAQWLKESTFQDEHGLALGSRVTVRAETFGPESTEGVLLAATRTHYSLRREDARAGTVQVHFPRVGYVLQAAESSG